MQSNVIQSALRPHTSGAYVVNEIFYSIQGEGVLAGVPMIFLRFADCNLRCCVQSVGFDCDTEFVSGREMTLAEIVVALADAYVGEQGIDASDAPDWILLTGGEPALQTDTLLLDKLRTLGYKIAIETNGTIELPKNGVGGVHDAIKHVCVSPKSAEHTIRQRLADEVKYVRRKGQAIPDPVFIVAGKNYVISPACQPDGSFLREDVEWCVDLVKKNPRWRLSLQLHKLLGVR